MNVEFCEENAVFPKKIGGPLGPSPESATGFRPSLDHILSPGGYSGFQVTGMIKWEPKSRPKKIPTASNKTQKIPGPKINP